MHATIDYDTELPERLYTAAAVRELDRRAIEDHGIPGSELMERAGAAAYTQLRQAWPEARCITVLCGGGNNGGDGFVIARLAQADGLDVRLISKAAATDLHGAARQAWNAAMAAGVPVRPFSTAELAAADVIVDALLGTGLDREVRGELGDWIAAVNAAAAPVLAVDIPSGLHADSGRILGRAVDAALTVTFIGMKVGLLTGAGRAICGRLHFADLGVPAAVYQGVDVAAWRRDYASLAPILAPRRANAHKGHFGHVLVIGGEAGYAGAARMAAEAAARSGAGLVSVATRPQHAAVIVQQRPELMVHAVDEPSALGPLLARASVVAVGPGLGRSDWALGLLGAVLDSPLPLVVDADALNLLAGEPLRRDNWLLTPHPGEAARLLDTDTASVQADRLAALAQLTARYGGAAVLKGSGTLIGAGDASPVLCSDGNPGMASGGMGDVLSGVLAGLLAQFYPHTLTLAETGALGVCLHAAAADTAAAGGGERGLLASDLFRPLRRLANPDLHQD
ncbi:NAD(P)H-hydrate epimerase [Methylohalomonas lacus]|uniref:Bifunctional NAD(P)H-hydrate repair enzyme n=1 Tax=Methylohalomonas lacus TaxID=398773 RepID=A0AAE3HJQ7_9GAMM|nr:NAD(P)H-hydrate dehydratase [Methylohalomonas lacus]MCS3902386.1 NAD(P)H-hydrate epimerase [Methylohalomonas lacus]